MTGRRGLTTALLGCLAAGAIVLLSSGRVWGHTIQVAETGRRVAVSVTGRSAEPALPVLGFTLLVLTGALVATRGWLRRLVGALTVAIGGAVCALAVAARSDVASSLRRHAFGVAHVAVHQSTSAWAVLTFIAGLLAASVGALAVFLGPRWPALGSRYDGPSAPPRPDPRATDAETTTWEALDRGEDPTV